MIKLYLNQNLFIKLKLIFLKSYLKSRIVFVIFIYIFLSLVQGSCAAPTSTWGNRLNNMSTL